MPHESHRIAESLRRAGELATEVQALGPEEARLIAEKALIQACLDGERPLDPMSFVAAVAVATLMRPCQSPFFEAYDTIDRYRAAGAPGWRAAANSLSEDEKASLIPGADERVTHLRPEEAEVIHRALESFFVIEDHLSTAVEALRKIL